jgi:hypothetical protein
MAWLGANHGSGGLLGLERIMRPLGLSVVEMYGKSRAVGIRLGRKLVVVLAERL